MINREYKIKLLELLFTGEITIKDFNTVVEMGVPHIIIEHTKNDRKVEEKISESIEEVYNKLGEPLTKIIFEDVSKKLISAI